MAGKALRILLVEDNPINQKVALLMLKKLGYCADVATNGLEALKALEYHHYDVILMDIQMPGMDGIEATKRIREYWLNRSIIIIAITAHALEFTREDCLKAGMDGYMTKPITTEDLKAALDMARDGTIAPCSLQRQ
ncbi:MAG TPA: response regulator [Methanotrichaceae archaeon]|nr:response regulator [Methanotrichaceae archaeon]